ncbi:MAG: D-2-hydroxyacid dehydrogenase [Lachnospiraceae bacterium]|nr:D-2-hydroxyacid dehydrogenase [Lachnospiraceae bacterium]
MKIVVLDRTSVGEDVSVECMKSLGDISFYNSTPNELIAERIEDADIVVANKNLLNENTMAQAKNVKLVCQFATGYDNVDIDYCKKRGIRVANVRNYSTASVAQHTIALALSVLENMPYYDEYVKSGAYSAQERFTHFGKTYYELDGKTWGIIGMGNIGRSVAKIAEALGCKVIFYSASGKSTCTDYEQVDFDALLARSDVISLHCPLSDRTRHIMNGAAFDKMKETAILINVARGAVVDTQALYEALKERKIRSAGLDVFEKEPMTADNPLKELKDTGILQLTPHMAWGSIEARTRCVTETCKNIEAFLQGQERNLVV